MWSNPYGKIQRTELRTPSTPSVNSDVYKSALHRSKFSADGANYGGTQPHDWGKVKSDDFPAGFFKTTDDYNIGLKKK